MYDIAFRIMSGAVTVWMLTGSVLVWAWPLLARSVPWKPKSQFLFLILPRGITICFVILSALALIFHAVVTRGEVQVGTVLCIFGLMADVMMRSILKRQFAP